VSESRGSWLTKSRALRSLEHRDWRKLWFVSQLWHLPFWMDYVILGWVVLERTDSPFLVALVGAFRLLPMGTLGFIAGTQADRWPRKRMLMVTQFFNFLLSGAMGVAVPHVNTAEEARAMPDDITIYGAGANAAD